MWKVVRTDITLDEMREHYAKLHCAGKKLEVSYDLLPPSVQKTISQQCEGKDKKDHLPPGTTLADLSGKVILDPCLPHGLANTYYYNKCIFESHIGKSRRTIILSANKSKEIFFYGREIY